MKLSLLEQVELARFGADVLAGLARRQKQLSCKYLYDDRGSALFDEICATDDYYLTRVETAILRGHADAIATRCGSDCLIFELGSGSSVKTRILLDCLRDCAGYVPIDICRSHLNVSAVRLRAAYPRLPIRPIHGDFAAPHLAPLLEGLAQTAARTVVFFPGSTIGNFSPNAAAKLLQRLADLGGGLLIGFDLVKPVEILHAAYNDRAGVTAAFNLNMLVRINRELGANFAVSRFRHRASYNADQSRIEMHLVSQQPQTVEVGGKAFEFAGGESILTECSYKYTLATFADLAQQSGWTPVETWTDEREFFAVQYLVPDAAGPSPFH